MQSTGHTGMHNSQPVHSSSMTVCITFGPPTMQSTGQALRHKVQPMHQPAASSACGFELSRHRPAAAWFGRLGGHLAGVRLLVGGRCGLMSGDEVTNLRVDLFTPAAAREDAVVTGAFDVVVELAVLRDAGAKVMRGARLTGARDVVEFAFDGQQGGRLDVLRTHQLTLDFPRAVDEREVLEHDLDG